MSNPKGYDSTVARIAGNLLSGQKLPSIGACEPEQDVFGVSRRMLAKQAVAMARAIVDETKRTEPAVSDTRAQCEAQKQKADA